jgi:Peptidase A4 family
LQPTADCSTTNRSTYSSFWVGLDGYNSNSVEQIGTDADCSHGRASYYAWYEMYPAPSVSIANFPITPGTAYTAEVKYTGNGSFTLTLAGGGRSFSTTQTLQNAPRSSAEWIAEAPSLCAGGCHITPLTDFGRVDFTGASADSAAIDSWSYDPLTMITNGGQAKAQPSALSNNGTAFSVTWSHF